MLNNSYLHSTRRGVHFIGLGLLWLVSACSAPVEPAGVLDSGFVTEYVTPTRVMLTQGTVEGADLLLQPYCGQVSTSEDEVVRMEKGGMLLLDFGTELQGGIQIVRTIHGSNKAARFRLVLGESVSEALSDINDPKTTATNDHSVRDMEISVPWLGVAEYGNSGFRFARLELLDADGGEIALRAVRAIFRKRDLPYLGSFKSSDERLNEIWQTGAYTVHLCMQDYLWDGIKRDRLVWIGDMHPEVVAVNTVFGNQQVVRKSLDYVRDKTAPTDWMNGICSYSLWWIILQHHLYQWYGDKAYLEEQQEYMTALLHTVMQNVKDNKEAYTDGRFIDWPSNDQPDVIHAGLQALTVRALEAGAEMADWLKDSALQTECIEVAKQLRTYVPDHVGNSQAAALLSIQGMLDAEEASAIILKNGPEKFTSFMGYYLLEALAKGGHYAEAMDLIKTYWGRMLDLGATTFWEDFNFNNAKNAARIDEIVPEEDFDIHADGGAWCYVGLRHSFCHGWASGPTSWLSEHVLGIEPVGVGFKEVRIQPHLGNLEWAEGTFPTPYGVISVRHTKNPDGSVQSDVKLPKGVKRVK
ncbi:MAG: alpha-L-rhamnosidase [Bacteroidales bacterium]|nr:alpha-L-rhamnosidase [Bacteroidales bacterium]